MVASGRQWEEGDLDQIKEAVSEYIDEVYRAVRVSQLLNR